MPLFQHQLWGMFRDAEDPPEWIQQIISVVVVWLCCCGAAAEAGLEN